MTASAPEPSGDDARPRQRRAEGGKPAPRPPRPADDGADAEDAAPEPAADRPQAAGPGAAPFPVEALLEKHMPALRAWIRHRSDRLVASKESSSDLAQSVCREVIEHLHRFEHRSEEGFKQWLYRTAERKIIDRYRYYTATKREASRELADGGADASDPALLLFPTPSQDAIAREELAAAELAFSRLPNHYREVILLSRVHGLSHAQIAARLGRSEGAVRNLLYRGLAAISDELGAG